MLNVSDRSNIRDDLVHLFIATPQGQTITVRDVNLSIDDVSRLQQAWESSPFSISVPQVFDEAGHHNVRLVFAGKDLEVGHPLERYGLVRGSTVQVLGRLKGGAQLGKAVKGRSQVKKKGADKPKEYSDLQAKYAKMQEMETRRQQAMAAKAELRRRVEQEGKNSKMNRLKIQNQWRKIMRLSKVESLRKDIEILSQNHERDVDRKDAIIQMLDRDIEEADDQFQAALKTHLQNTDRLIDLQDSRLLTLEQEFEVELKALQEDFAEERKQIVAEHAAQVQELNDIIAAVEAQEAEKEDEAKQDHEQHREEIRNKNLEEINVLRIMLDSQIEELEQIFEAAHINYLENTDQRTTDFKYLTSKDQQLSRDIEIKIRKIERLQSGLQHWRTKIAQNVKENAERNRFLTEERNAIQGHFHHLKGRMNKFRAAQAKRLGELAQNVNAVRKRLKEQVDLANKIITLAELARKAESEKEKVLPFYVSGYNDEVEEEAERTERKPTGAREAEISLLNPLQTWALGKHEQPVLGLNRLDNFHKRYNKALLEKLAIEREQRRLEAENRDLKGIVKQYLDGISIPEDAVGSDANTLLVVNGRVNFPKQDTDPERSENVATAIDGNHMVSTGRVNNRMGL